MPHWYATYPGLNIVSADMTYSHGVTPSVCHINATPLESTLAHGTLAFMEDGFARVTFKGCAVFRAIAEKTKVRRGQRINVDILDRRWRWRYSTISGKYNVLDSAGDIIAATKVTYEELISLLLDALGEADYEIDLPFPIPDAPPVDWNDSRADLALAELVEFIGCIVHLGQDNLTHVVQVGDGPLYPALPASLIPNVDFTPQHYPAAMEVVCGPTVYQAQLTLEAVGLDIDGSVKALPDLTYAKWPLLAWSHYYIPGTTGNAVLGGEPTLDDAGVDSSEAISTVYRWYRIKEIKYTGLALPDGNPISDINNILPLLPRIVTRDSGVMNHDVGPLPFVSGTWLDPFTGKSLESKHYRSFELDHERGIVMFREFMFDKTATTPWVFAEADIALTAAFYARESAATGRYRQAFEYTVDGGSNGVATIVRNDIYEVNVSGVSNRLAVANDCKAAGNAHMKIYGGIPQSAGKWVGIVVYPPAGNIQQFRWVVNAFEAVTYGGKNLEHPMAGPLRVERRVREILSKELPLC